MFAPRWFGTTFNVQYASDHTMRKPVKGHLITNSETIDIIAPDWQSVAEQISVLDIDRVDGKGTTVTVFMKLGYRYPVLTLNCAPEPCAHLQEAVTPLPSIPRAEPYQLLSGAVIRSFKSHAPGQLPKAVLAEVKQLFQLLRGSVAEHGPLIDAFVCAYRMRFTNDGAAQVEQSVQTMSSDLRRSLLVHWCASLVRALQPTQDPISSHFQNAMALCLGATIEKVAKSLSSYCEDLNRALQPDTFTAHPEMVQNAARRLGQEAQDGMDKEARSVPPNDTGAAKLLLTPLLIMLSGAIAGMYNQDLEDFARAIVAYTVAVLERGTVETVRAELLEKQNQLLLDLLRFLDGFRYREKFQWIYCVWGLRTATATTA
jgi:hypothetical protein